MAVTINADTTNGLVLTPDTSGNIEIQSAGTAVGEFNSNGYKPTTAHTFSVKKTSNQGISSGVYTKCTWSSENWDIGSGFDLTNSKFQPTVAGYYHLTVNIRYDGSTNYTRGIVKIYKNGSAYKRLGDHADSVNNQNYGLNGSCLIYMNGSTDYAEVYILVNASTAVIGNSSADELIFWDGYLVAQA